MATLLLGQTLTFDADPFHTDIGAASQHERRGAVLIERGHIAAVGKAEVLRQSHPQAEIIDYGASLISAGFVDAHAHFPQTAIIASWGKRLIDWLNTYTFPEELRFGDPAYAAEIATRYLDLLIANGTTSVCSYGTVHTESVTAFFEEAARRGLRAIAGKTCMDRNAPEGLCDTPERAYDESAALIAEWHGHERLGYAITPRFTPTSTEAQLEALGRALGRASHLSDANSLERTS